MILAGNLQLTMRIKELTFQFSSYVLFAFVVLSLVLFQYPWKVVYTSGIAFDAKEEK